MKEKPGSSVPGGLMLVVCLAIAIGAIYVIVQGSQMELQPTLWIAAGIAALILDIILLAGFFIVSPNYGVALQLFGDYKGSLRKPGLHWANPFLSKRRLSLRVRNFETAHLKVNDHTGNPIEIAAVVVWRVIDTAEALFQVDAYDNYVHVQSESALRNLATAYAYDAHDDTAMSLRGNTADVAAHLREEIQERLAVAGVEVIEARISHLAYAPEIAAVMLQRQQASAIIAARSKIVEGAVGMVEMAIDLLAKKGVIEFDSERKAAMVSNLLVVLCGDRATQPVVNTGTIYH